MNVLTIIGARPQFIKAATISHIIKAQKGISEILVHTGQHFDDVMSAVFFEELGIPAPSYNLGISGGHHGQQTGKMLIGLEEVLLKEKPDIVLLYGDTNSTLAGALAAVKLHIPVAHVEAGLRSFNKRMPEEINRIFTDHSSNLLFVPTSTATKNLLREGFDPNSIIEVGDVMYDATLRYGEIADARSSVLTTFDLKSKGYLLTTIHRAENTDDSEKLQGIFVNLEKIAREEQLVMPLHPRTKQVLHKLNYSFKDSPITFIEPVGYLDMLMLEKHASVIITDSGGVQKEAYFQKVPCITLREETEWTELVANGWNFLAAAHDLQNVMKKAKATTFKKDQEIYGNGDAAVKIVDKLLDYGSRR